MSDLSKDRPSLIERAAQRLEQERGPDAAAALRTRGDAVAAEPAAGGHADDPDGQSERVHIDLQRLDERGFITPSQMRGRLAQEVRVIKRSVVQVAQNPDIGRSNLIMISSANPREGKSFLAINLAISLACEVDYHVLLIDADFSRPRVFHHLGLEPRTGLMDFLRDRSLNVSDIMLRTDMGKLSLIGPGRHHQLSTELLASDRMAQFAEELSTRYPDRLIIFDAPPLLACTEPSVLAENIGQVAFVVEADKTTRPTVRRALNMLPSTCWVSLVLNKCRVKTVVDYYGDYGYPRS
ncbi:exopolysaccharide/PEP-CTERM locus tyrosine autokinase [Rhodothalassium salexigens DSM 2132]|uniref:Exopolysaccharide/PEP-CTERM locus tyrosine autokinase n=1 Tax=Rhodothalassium salexigens DSM 2132 TaxID=1188247 RepID=A0A4R2PEK1_RHOSA|nr:XrtA-associated tyrosine autokinase [Rhodothalassium salexigens]MBB4212037.1 receptor protein-tyrosine kinase [Rhodothalassium salexigens DSM 2132]MBK1638108.1 hypothetical protein [Rhodothalassium salexigens DSM 2132]TCP32914.1 exopolysaccharide/PEP-CTERM locus tyrosine autokinase [Rhodothalassium salexigens DSM 2132]